MEHTIVNTKYIVFGFCPLIILNPNFKTFVKEKASNFPAIVRFYNFNYLVGINSKSTILFSFFCVCIIDNEEKILQKILLCQQDTYGHIRVRQFNA